VFDAASPGLETLLALVEGTRAGAEVGHPGIEKGICFPLRYLKLASMQQIPSLERREALEGILARTLCLGLLSYLMNLKFGSRAAVPKVDTDRVINEWLPKSMIADHLLFRGEFPRVAPEIPAGFDALWELEIEPTVKANCQVGRWGIGKIHAYFRNLFAAGALLGLSLDQTTN